jgi:hypothetical protein
MGSAMGGREPARNESIRGSAVGGNRAGSFNDARAGTFLDRTGDLEVVGEDDHDDFEDDSEFADSDLEGDNDLEDAAEMLAENYADLMYNSDRSAADINYDHYHFSVAKKYDLASRDLTYKKMKYIYDEVFLDLHLRMWRTIQFQTNILVILMLYFMRMMIHSTGQYVLLSVL